MLMVLNFHGEQQVSRLRRKHVRTMPHLVNFDLLAVSDSMRKKHLLFDLLALDSDSVTCLAVVLHLIA
jgi:hypothetical protein